MRKIKKGFKTKVETEKAQAKIYEDLNKGLNPVDTKVTLKEAGELYMRLHVSNKKIILQLLPVFALKKGFSN